MNNTVSYKCPGCGAPLAYGSESGMLECAACGNKYETSAIEALSKADSENQTEFDWGAYKDKLEKGTLENAAVYQCKSCGAEIVTDEATAATKCPYCDNVVVLTSRLSGDIKPNGIIPFKIGKDKIPDIVKGFCKGKRLLPKAFLDENKIKEVRGIYVPFWLFGCRADGQMTFDATRVRTWHDSQYDYTETSHYLLTREGEMAFDKIPVDGSVKMDDTLMDSLEPFDFSKLVSFDSTYLSGYLADKFDDDADKCLPRASTRVETSTEDMLRSTVSGYMSAVKRTRNINLLDTSVKYVLLPVYLIKSKYRDKIYDYAINGETGKIVGELPVSRAKYWAWFAGVSAAVMAVLSLIMFL